MEINYNFFQMEDNLKKNNATKNNQKSKQWLGNLVLPSVVPSNEGGNHAMWYERYRQLHNITNLQILSPMHRYTNMTGVMTTIGMSMEICVPLCSPNHKSVVFVGSNGVRALPLAVELLANINGIL
jgi:hypothetical protein